MRTSTSASWPVRCALTALVALLALTSACATGTATSGRTVTSTPSTPPSSAPVRAYFGGGDRVYALDGRTGAVEWTYITGHGVGAGGITDTAVMAGVVFVHGTDVDATGRPVPALYALDAATGAKRWELLPATVPASAGKFNGLMIANPVAVVGRTVYLVVQGGQVPSGTYALDLASGKLLWGADGLGAEAVTIGDRAIYVTQMPGASSTQGPSDEILTALDPATGKQLWQLHGVGGALLAGGLLYGLSLGAPATLTALDAATGATRWTRPLVGQNLGLSLVGPSLFVGDPAGVTALDPATGQLRWHYATAGASAWYLRIGGEGATLCLEYHAQTAMHLVGVDAATGTQRWARVLLRRPAERAMAAGMEAAPATSARISRTPAAAS